ncbi:MAG: glycoside hydrolase N-terminal domain-containing protein [Acidobacteriia bacterium]|nr:glycoside hydrolase N-terminal domain-containing protein [Terriglobia bacterium]
MRRRDFLRKGTVAAAGIAGSPKLLPPLTASESGPQKPFQISSQILGQTGVAREDNRSIDYLRRAQGDEFLPKLPVLAESYRPVDVQVSPMPLAERIKRNIVPRRGLCSIAPGKSIRESLLTGNGTMFVELMGDPYSEQVLFHHESLLVPWKRPFEAPKVAAILPQLRQMLLDGKYREGVDFAFRAMQDAGMPLNLFSHPTIPAFTMHLEFPKTAWLKDYLRTVDFESGEVKVVWNDEHGDWLRQTLASRPDDVVVQLLTAPRGQPVNARISLQNPSMMRMGDTAPISFEQDCSERMLIFACRFDPAVDNSGYAGVTRVIRMGGSARNEEGTLVIENASSVMLLTRIEWFADYSQDKVESLRLAVEHLNPDYDAMLERHRQGQAPVFNRVSVDFGGGSQHGMASEELLTDQRTRPDYSPALLEKMFEMGRYWFILSSGKYPPMVAEVNANINLQISGGPMGGLREGMESYFDWMESILPDCRNNAKNIFGARGAVFPILPDKGIGVSFHYASQVDGGIWPHPYWISAGGWCYRPFWDHYLVTGDLEFLRNRVVPGLKELALFYEDFLKLTDKDGNYVFVPSYSPENWPDNAEPLPLPRWPEPRFSFAEAHTVPPTPLVINATMDISVCREVLTHLIQASEILGTDADSVPKWRAMLEKMPPYLLDKDGTLKEWAWPTFEERLDHRHVSHLYGAWPGDEIDPDRTPQLAKAALLADRKRAPETLAAHGLCHRALVGARLKDYYLVDYELRQLFEQGYVGPTLTGTWKLGPWT